MNQEKVDKRRLQGLKVEISDDEMWLFKKSVRRSGMKQQSWIRVAILEKVSRDSEASSAFDNH